MKWGVGMFFRLFMLAGAIFGLSKLCASDQAEKIHDTSLFHLLAKITAVTINNHRTDNKLKATLAKTIASYEALFTELAAKTSLNSPGLYQRFSMTCMLFDTVDDDNFEQCHIRELAAHVTGTVHFLKNYPGQHDDIFKKLVHFYQGLQTMCADCSLNTTFMQKFTDYCYHRPKEFLGANYGKILIGLAIAAAIYGGYLMWEKYKQPIYIDESYEQFIEKIGYKVIRGPHQINGKRWNMCLCYATTMQFCLNNLDALDLKSPEDLTALIESGDQRFNNLLSAIDEHLVVRDLDYANGNGAGPIYKDSQTCAQYEGLIKQHLSQKASLHCDEYNDQRKARTILNQGHFMTAYVHTDGNTYIYDSSPSTTRYKNTTMQKALQQMVNAINSKGKDHWENQIS